MKTSFFGGRRALQVLPPAFLLGLVLVLASPYYTEAQEDGDEPPVRNPVGDLNADAVRAGDFPGAFKIPGPGNVSLAIGGAVKVQAIRDSDAEAMGADFFPAYLGTSSADERGATSLDATLSRLFVDGRAPVGSARVRGYIEWEFSGGNDGNLRLTVNHAYGTWGKESVTFTAGHTWSTLMDTAIIPEGLTDAAVNGLVFVRQPQFRVSYRPSREFTVEAAVEDPASTDVFSPVPVQGYTTAPDGALGVEYDRGAFHARLGGIARNVEVRLPAGGGDSAVAWGSALTARWAVFGRDWLGFGGVYGDGAGRYLLGIPSTSGSAFDPATETLTLRNNWGAMASYRHQWSDPLRSSVMFGYAYAEPLDPAAGDTFESSAYGAVNLMWSILPYLTVGVEYDYGKRNNTYVDDLDNHRGAFGVQFF